VDRIGIMGTGARQSGARLTHSADQPAGAKKCLTSDACEESGAAGQPTNVSARSDTRTAALVVNRFRFQVRVSCRARRRAADCCGLVSLLRNASAGRPLLERAGQQLAGWCRPVARDGGGRRFRFWPTQSLAKTRQRRPGSSRIYDEVAACGSCRPTTS
jgi:hypothetical protein